MNHPTVPFRECSPEDLLGPLNEVERKNAPAQLFVAGDMGFVRRGACVAIVGSRKASPEGIRRARRLASELTKHGVVVVSGLAEGIDTAAHTACIEAGGKTIAVLGTPLDQVYPRANADLQMRIMRDHLAVSQFPSGQAIARQNFARRNRVMALISDATVIVEAGDSSGSISQGWEAIRLGRLLFVMKSIVDSPHLRWPAEMLRYGAQELTDTAPILGSLPVDADWGVVSAAF